MTTDLIPCKKNGIGGEFQNTTSDMSVSANGLLNNFSSLPEILFITSFPPRECGIATYSQDLIDALGEHFENSFQSSICALETDVEQHIYSSQPKFVLNTYQKNAYTKTAFKINRDANIKLVVMQHEFGFFEKKKMEFHELFLNITAPIVFVFHTVLPNPNKELKANVQDMARIASSVIVMTQDAKRILKKDYNVNPIKITVIPHGTHLVPLLNSDALKEMYQLTNRTVLATFGLLGKNKSIETTLDALPKVVKKYPNVLFLVLGKTHPSIIKEEGEQYRTMLEEKVKTLKLEKHVRFVNEYLQLPILLEYLQLTDIYLFTSNDTNQAVSGTFSYAVSSGCPVISTPIPHAKEVLANDSGIIFDFENSVQLSKAILSLLANKKLRDEISSNGFHKMASTAWQNSAIAHALLFENITGNAFNIKYKIPDVDLSHVKKMTTDFGMIQFSKIAEPDLQSGYTLDDNARALIALCHHYELFQNKQDLEMINTYLQFIKFCQQEDGSFLNYVNTEKEFTSQNYFDNLDDSNGRAMWALGYVLSLQRILPIDFYNQANIMFYRALPMVTNIDSTRAMAFIIKGLYYHNNSENIGLLETLANRLVQMYKHERQGKWHWFETYFTYGNGVLPEALLCAYLITNNVEYKKIAKESFRFLLSKIFVDDTIKVISNKGWHVKDQAVKNVLGGEQAIDVGYTIMALSRFYKAFKKEQYKQKAIIAFDWFFGKNHLHQIVYNPCTGGCYDGVEEYNINLNQGAESTISYLLSRLGMHQLINAKHENHKETNADFDFIKTKNFKVLAEA